MTEINASDGSWVSTISGGSYGFDVPTGVTVDGSDVWVANYHGNSLTEVTTGSGAWVRTLSGGSYAFNGPSNIAVAGTDVWVTNQGTLSSPGNSVTEVSASDGSLVRRSRAARTASTPPTASPTTVRSVGHQRVRELGDRGRRKRCVVRTLSGGSYGFVEPTFPAFDGTDLWVTNQSGKSVTEVKAGDGSWVATLS